MEKKIAKFSRDILLILLLLFTLRSVSYGLEASPSDNIQDMPGAGLFKAKTCYSCHSIGNGKLVGPDLKGLFERRDEVWVRKFILDPTSMTASDPIAIKLKAEYMTQMPNPILTPEELNQLIAYLKAATK